MPPKNVQLMTANGFDFLITDIFLKFREPILAKGFVKHHGCCIGKIEGPGRRPHREAETVIRVSGQKGWRKTHCLFTKKEIHRHIIPKISIVKVSPRFFC